MKRKKIITVSVGIPAFNEEANIQKLVTSLLKQVQSNYVLQSLIIVTDGCTDKTIEKIRSIKSRKIQLEVGQIREGKSARLNQLFRLNKSDILIIIDADIQIRSTHLISSMVSRINVNSDSLIGISAIPLRGTNFLENCINYSMEMQLEIRKKWNNKNNYLCYRGAFLAFTAKFIQKIKVPTALVNNDTYFYFLTQKYQLNAKYLDDLYVYYQSPRTFTDHLQQSSRFQGSKDELTQYFQLKNDEYTIPRHLVLSVLCNYFLRNPVYFSGYLFIFLLTKIMKTKMISHQWKIASSTKLLYSTKYD